MSICKAIFKKSIYELKKEDVTNFFSEEQEETSILEFKSGEIEIDKIFKQVSAFLNTEGGLLILGAPKETERENGSGKKKNICVGELTPATKISNQDTLMRSIASNISPSPSGIKAISFEHLSGFVYVLEIPQSLTPPHQVSNEGKYYIRLERDAKPAPHGIVEALFQKRQKPNLIVGIGINTKFHFPDSLFVYFNFTNESLISAESIG